MYNTHCKRSHELTDDGCVVSTQPSAARVAVAAAATVTRRHQQHRRPHEQQQNVCCSVLAQTVELRVADEFIRCISGSEVVRKLDVQVARIFFAFLHRN